MAPTTTHRPQRLQEVLHEASDVLQAVSCRDGEWQIDLKTQAMAPVAEDLAESLDTNLAALFIAPVDGEDWCLHAVLPAVDDQAYLHLRARLPAGSRDYPLLDRHFAVAARYQKENAVPGLVRPVREEIRLDGAGVFQFPLGPVRGDCNETVGILIDTIGEQHYPADAHTGVQTPGSGGESRRPDAGDSCFAGRKGRRNPGRRPRPGLLSGLGAPG